VVPHFHRFRCFDTACHRDGGGTCEVTKSLVLGSGSRRAAGPAYLPGKGLRGAIVAVATCVIAAFILISSFPEKSN
jgi:hypothetical protein